MTQTRTTQGTKNGTASNAIGAELMRNKDSEGLSREEINLFLNEVSDARDEWMRKGRGPLPEIEVDRKVIERFNRSGMDSFDETLCFIYQDVKVFEKGKKEEALRRENMTMEEKIHGRKHG